MTRSVLLIFCLTLIARNIANAEEYRPAILNNVTIDQRLNSQIPLDLVFHDEDGRDVKLRSLLAGRPIVLNLVYYKCPTLCTTVLNELTATLNVIPDSMGENFDVLTVSFDPNETPQLASEKKASYLRVYRRAGASKSWHFLTGDPASIAALTHSVGFSYTWDPQFQQYAHAAGIIILTPEGKVSSYLFGVTYPPADLHSALIRARDRQPASLTSTILLYCFHYDPSTGRYTLAVLNLLKVAAIVTLIGLTLLIVFNLRHEKKLEPQQ